MLIRFALPPCPDSPLARLDPRWRLAGLLLALVAAAVVQTLAGACLALTGSILLALLARMPARWFLARLTIVALGLGLFGLLGPLFSGLPWLEALTLMAVIVLRGVALFTLASVLLVTAPVEVTARAAHALFVPGLFVQLAILTYRYLFLLGDELARLRIALRVRGYRNRASLRSYQTIAAATGTLLLRGHDRAEQVAAAMRTRGFDGTFHTLHTFQTRTRDVLAFTLVLAASTGLVFLDRMALT